MTGIGKSCKENDYKILAGNVDEADMVFLWSFYKNPKDIVFHTDIRRSLPHWKLSTFIDEVEKLCACIFLFNSHNRTVDIVMLDKFYDEQASLYTIQSSDILDEFEVEFDDKASDKDLTTSSISFDRSYTDPYMKVSKDVLDSIENRQYCADWNAIQQSYNKMTNTDRCKTLFTDESTGREYIHYEDEKGVGSLKEINIFGDLIRENTNGSVSMKIVPANTCLFDVGWWFDSFQGSPSQSLKINVPFTTSEVKTPEYTKAQEIIENSYSPDREESSDCMEVMLHTGGTYPITSYQGSTFRYPVPFTDYLMPGSAQGHLPEMSLSLKPVCEQSLGYLYRHIPTYRSDKKYVVRFLDRHVPDQRQIFLLHNQRYVCYKLSADFDNRTRDFLIEGEFFRID